VDSPESLAQHAIMVAKLKAFMNAPQQTFIDFKEKDTSFPARYARAIAYYRALDTDHALKLENALIADYPDNPYLWELKGQTLFESAHIKEAVVAHRRAVELKPAAPLLQFLLGQAIVAEEDKTKIDDAIAHLRLCVGMEKDNALCWRVLAEAYDMKGDDGQARLAVAEQNFYLGQMREARSFAMRAREKLPKNSAEWRRATDIVLASAPSPAELQAMARQ
jgi:predicted Zn-dependent protease